MEMPCFLEVHQGIGNDNDGIPHHHLPGCGAVQTNATTAPFAFNNIGLEPLSVIIIDDLHLLSRDHVRGIHQVLVDGNAAHIVQVGFRHLHAMELRLQNFDHHWLLCI